MKEAEREGSAIGASKFHWEASLVSRAPEKKCACSAPQRMCVVCVCVCLCVCLCVFVCVMRYGAMKQQNRGGYVDLVMTRLCCFGPRESRSSHEAQSNNGAW